MQRFPPHQTPIQEARGSKVIIIEGPTRQCPDCAGTRFAPSIVESIQTFCQPCGGVGLIARTTQEKPESGEGS